MKKVKLFSPAKINLTLEIIKKLPNGFHDLRSVMYKTENLKDEVEITFNHRQTGIKIICNNKNVPIDEKNICHKIAQKFFVVSGKRVGLNIKIKKRIPLAAGLGGGSSNGAAVLLALNKYFKKPLKYKDLVTLAAEVGKDIPFFISKKKEALVKGAGEKVQTIKNFPKLNLLLINPQGEISTAWAYSQLDERMWFMENSQRKNISRKLLKCGNSAECIGQNVYNDFSIVAEELFPVIKEIKNALIVFGAVGAEITGKGPTVVGFLKTKNDAIAMRRRLRKKYPQFFIEIA
ncbi:MAG: 4-(cytidine 5'-diphospho)-2-C-methyl-D-erythritol kinase [Candidatus Moraniibacteriota bacterium]